MHAWGEGEIGVIGVISWLGEMDSGKGMDGWIHTVSYLVLVCGG